MVEIINMPQLSDTMEEGKLIKWHKKIGDKILEGDLLAEIETDKAIQEFESDTEGYLLYIGVKENEKVKVNSLLAIIGEKKENLDKILNSIKSNKKSKKENFLKKENHKYNNAIEKKSRIFASPLAKKIAKKEYIDLKKIKTNNNKRIKKKDIYEYINLNRKNLINIENKVNKNLYINNKKIDNFSSKVKNSSMRNIIAKRLSISKFTAPHYYLIIDVNMDNIILSRNIINSKIKENKISFNDIIIKSVSLSIKNNPKINSSWNEDSIIYHKNINIGFAVSVEEGLFVPVINSADKKTLKEISVETKDKILRSRSKKIENEEIKNSTFTVSNLGMFGISFFTSIINQPNSCILSVGTILEKPIVKNGKISIGNISKFTLSCDHRVIDGVVGSSFLNDIKYIIENPITMLI